MRATVGAVFLRLTDDAAGDARRGSRSCAACYGVNHDRSSSIAKDGGVIVAEGYVGRDDRNVGGAVGANDERKIRDVASRCCVMAVLSAAGIEMRAGGLEVGRFAFCDLMNVDGVFAWRQILDVQCDFDAFRSAGKLG